MKEFYHLSIVGCGARGLHALELYFISLSRKRIVDYLHYKILLFEPHDILGTGLAWDPRQSETNVSNISDRALETFDGRPEFEIQGVRFPSFPNYLQWLAVEHDVEINSEKDSFSLRKITGAYLQQRAKTIVEPLEKLGLITIVKERVQKLAKRDGKIELSTTSSSHYGSTHVILALGHLSNNSSRQNLEFQEHARETNCDFNNKIYTAAASAIYHNSKHIAIKGFGLAMIDVVGMIMSHQPGSFEEVENDYRLKYKGDVAIQIIPFSLDGLPMVPKPVGKKIDDYFDVVAAGKERMLVQLKNDIHENKIKCVDDILKLVAQLTIRIYNGFESNYANEKLDPIKGIELIIAWLKDQSTKSEHIINTKMPALDYMKLTCKMSHGKHPFSLDYTIGQVWRMIQIDLYYLYSYRLLPKDIVKDFIILNDKAKRYSFGPPVKSILELVALQEAGILRLEFVSNPEIKLVRDGYEIVKESKSIICDAMIDSVLARPNADDLDDELMISIIDRHLGQKYVDDLGIQVTTTGNHVVDDQIVSGLYSVGRNTKGSIHGVDAILECFIDEKMQPMIDEILRFQER
ncbi:FAD/NAD(P)-binding protein [Nonlabens antarcticus]|uniref:FAD/NAD(P)-binding protein n=1 Tax=Nonlabens antarcticus TaxID=392714 RepID=UPI001891A600|nr:FAD/NAD(P)-binding protein [Nonlabens antarcticus]